MGKTVIRKFGFGQERGRVRVSMYEGFVVKGVETQRNHPVIYAEGDEKAKPQDREFFLALTGGDIPEGFSFVGTAMLDGGDYVLHVYEYRGVNGSLHPSNEPRVVQTRK